MASSKTLVPCLALLLLFVISFSEAKNFHIGGRRSSWKIPSYPTEYNHWASKKRFQIGDSIDMKYDGKVDSVLEVSEEDYKNCNKSNPIKTYNDGNTKITFDKSGPFYFISGAEGHCEKGQKIEIRVITPKHVTPPAAAPQPSPASAGDSIHHVPAPAPHRAAAAALNVGFMSGVFAVVGVFLALF
ncbi:hypothetical protein ABFX02_10G125500 [Erythranthe guttata]